MFKERKREEKGLGKGGEKRGRKMEGESWSRGKDWGNKEKKEERKR